MTRIALTGGIAAGKSTVLALLLEEGARVLSADELAREVVAEPEVLARIEARFGSEVIAETPGNSTDEKPRRTLNRPHLASLVFADAGAREDLEAITHPLIRARALARMETYEQEAKRAGEAEPVIVYEIPLFVESDANTQHWDHIVHVTAPEETRIARLVHDRGMTEEAARARIAAQAHERERARFATYTLRTDCTREELANRVRELYPVLNASAR